MKFKHVGDVARWRLCLGCGACVSVCPQQKITLVDIENDGIRPLVSSDDCEGCEICLGACPGIETIIEWDRPQAKQNPDPSTEKWGQFIELWEGYAGDPEIRLKGSSGGLCSALSLFALERGHANGVLHIGKRHERPTRNKTYVSRTREELLSRTGSRYSPASPCDGLGQIAAGDDPVVFIGKPCDVAGLRKAQRLKPELAKKTAFAIGFFCAGTPSTGGTLELIKRCGIDESSVSDFHNRGNGWPGMASIRYNQDRDEMKMTYQESWGFVQKFRPFRCYLCPDLTAELADISVGDPWYREIGENEPGRSLIVIRTEKGRNIFHQALSKGYVIAQKTSPEKLYRSQKNLLSKREDIWGRLLAMKLLGVPYPKLKGFYLYPNWKRLSFGRKIRSILGTAKRIILRRYYTPLTYDVKKNSWH